MKEKPKLICEKCGKETNRLIRDLEPPRIKRVCISCYMVVYDSDPKRKARKREQSRIAMLKKRGKYIPPPNPEQEENRLYTNRIPVRMIQHRSPEWIARNWERIGL